MIPALGNVLFLTEASVSVGTGHLRRCATLARYLATLGWLPQFQILGGAIRPLPEEAIQSILSGIPWQVVTKPNPLLIPVNLVIVDVPCPSQKAAVFWCHDQHLRCLALDYLQPDLLPDVVVTLKDLAGQMQSAFAQAGRPESYHEGVTYAMMRPSMLAHRKDGSPPGQNGVLNILVTLGGADPQGLTLEAIDSLRPWRNRLDRVTIVLGPGVGPELHQQVSREANQLDFYVVKAPSNFDTLLATTDLVLCNGGGTLLESLCLGRLTAVLPQTEAEAAFAEAFCQQQVCVWAREIGKIIETTLQERLEFAQRAASIVDGNGLVRLASIIADLASR